MSSNTPMAFLPSLSERASKAAALSVLAASGLIVASPGAAEAAACTGAYTIAMLEAASFSCDIGKVTYSAFRFTGISSGEYTFGALDPDYVFSAANQLFARASYSYTYQVALNSTAPVGTTFGLFNTGIATSQTSGPQKFTKVLSTTAATNPVGTSATASRNNGSSTVADPVEFAGGNIGPVVFNGSVTRDAGRVDVITDSFSLVDPNTTTPTPGPLPILGAGAAFGMSRKLRRRIKLA
jgi:hypothetical protein